MEDDTDYEKGLDRAQHEIFDVKAEVQAIATVLKHYRDEGSYDNDDLSGLGFILARNYDRLEAAYSMLADRRCLKAETGHPKNGRKPIVTEEE